MRWAGVTMEGGNGVAFSAQSVQRWMLFLKTLGRMDARISKCQQMLKKSTGDWSVDHAKSE